MRIGLCVVVWLGVLGVLGVLGGIGGVAGPAVASDAGLARGEAIATETCARCHAIGRDGDSPLAEAPPFRDIAARYSVWLLAESLAEGIMVGHEAMPQFAFEPAEIDDLLRYMATLEP